MGASEGGGAPWRESLQPLGPEGTRRVAFWGPGELELWERVSERCRGSDLFPPALRPASDQTQPETRGSGSPVIQSVKVRRSGTE